MLLWLSRLRFTKVAGLSLSAIFIIFAQNFLSGCLETNSQNPADSFADKKLPRHLERIANQKGEFIPSRVESIKKRVQDDKNNPYIQKVAVIDSGFDLAHPDLEKQIAFDIDEQGHIIGAGKDILGKDSFPSYVMVDPTLFAFGAKKVENGLIYEPHDNPIELMYEMDQRFKQILLEKIKNDPELKGSLFLRLNPKTFTIFGMKNFLKNQADALNKYADNLKYRPDWLIDENSEINNALPRNRNRILIRLKDLSQWNLPNLNNNLPLVVDNDIILLRGFDRFNKHLKDSFQQIDEELLDNGQKMEFSRHEKQVMDYCAAHSGPRISSEDIENQYRDKMFNAGAYMLVGHKALNPLERMRIAIAGLKKNPNLSTKEALEEVPKIMDELLKKIEAVASHYYSDDSNKNHLLHSQMRKMDYLLNIFKEAAKQIQVLASDSQVGNEARSILRKESYRLEHPYIDTHTRNNKHGTHVASLIAIQHPDIRIYPIKVATGPIKYSAEHSENLKQMTEDFNAWIQQPIVKKLISDIQNEYNLKDLSKKQIIQELQSYLLSDPSKMLFVMQVLEAIKEVGSQQIKLANVSLGTLYKKSSNPQDNNNDKKMRSLIEDLFAEYVRYRMGEAIQKYAPHTLFVIAAGNKSLWADGISQVIFPAQIFSRRFQKISDEHTMVPNNNIHNVVIVGSLNSEQSPPILSPFTNISFDLLPQIFSLGENIIGSLPKGSHDHSEEILPEWLKMNVSFKVISGSLSSLLADLDESAKWQPAGDESLTNHESPQSYIENIQDLVSNIEKIYPKVLECWYSIWNPVSRGPMSGTSMATPIATGLIAKALMEKMKAKKIPAPEIYDHPDFSPKEIIEKIIPKISDRHGLSFPILTLTRGMEKLPQPPLDKIQSLAKRVNKMTHDYKCKQLFF